MNLKGLTSLFAEAGCKKLYAKLLADNDNSKNQVYFGPGFHALNLFPNENIIPVSNVKNPIFKAKLKFGWLLQNGKIADAPNAQLILYPQYPEVRFSGFLQGCSERPSDLMAKREAGRILFLGTTKQRQIVGYVVAANSEIARKFRIDNTEPTNGVFSEIDLPNVLNETDSRHKLLHELRRINRLGWIDSKQLSSDGTFKPCDAPQCGGFTLEAELGIPKNSSAEPDFLGWEVKQHSVTHFNNVEVGQITLMTPEPTGGFYKDQGVEAFIRKFGYEDKNGRADRFNFGGIHKIGERHHNTHLTLTLTGYDKEAKDGKGLITNPNGSLALLSDRGEIAASWAFSGLLQHWSRKHSKAVYVPSQCRKEPARQYYYGDRVRLAQGTDSMMFLRALNRGAIYYDPGIKLENASSKPITKRRSQFRITSKSISALYETVDVVEV